MGNDVFVSLPTGSGKSVCYGILPIVFDLLREKPGSVVVVVSPLISLMKDQVVSMKKKGESMLYIMEKLTQIQMINLLPQILHPANSRFYTSVQNHY